jgi:hypothetical protein
MSRPKKDIALNTALGVALVVGLISFPVSFFLCLTVALNTGLMDWREQFAGCACAVVSCLVSWVAMRQTYRFFRNLSLPR